VPDIRVRAFYRAASVPGAEAPYNTINMKVYYPCAYGDSFEERNTGFIPVDTTNAPFPVVIMMPGINVSHESYSWLCHRLAENGIVALSYTWVGLEMENRVSVTPGVELEPLKADQYGSAPSCPAIAVIGQELERINNDTLLSGQLDLDRIILGGHSAGGTMALLNARPEWFPAIRGAFSYAAHVAANTLLGWEENSIMPLTSELPLLLMGGSRDGVIAASGFRYGDEVKSSPTERIERSFHEGIEGERGDRYLLIVNGANHFSMVRPLDTSTGRPFLDRKQKGSGKRIRCYLGDVILHFCHHACGDSAAQAELQMLCNQDHPLAKSAVNK